MNLGLLSFFARLVNRYLSLLGLRIKRTSPYENFIFPVESDEFEKLSVLNAEKYSMTPLERLWALTYACKHILTKNIPGDFVECGVWKGGNLILMSALIKYHGGDKKIYGFDTFSGMTEPTDIDKDLWGESAKSLLSRSEYKDGKASFYAFASKELVSQILIENGCVDVKLIEGDVLSTLHDKKNLPSSISVLRLDTDWYESTRIELEVLYPLLVPGGILIIDDYGHFSGARKAVDEYFKDERPFMFHVDYSCRMIIKEEKS
jgi:O-methyltransferase